ncbi:MAG: uroporphyrinogen decarboxylase family protein [Clostridiaceae bacterium]|nr:uroporphyrinogen decarboxylase family protein [Clostridiaceae bacterium]
MFYDPEYRMDIDQQMRRLLAERFTGLPLGERDPRRRAVQPTTNNALTPAAFGCDIFFPDDKYAQWHPMDSYDRLIHHRPGDLRSVFPFNEIIRQTRLMNEQLGIDEQPFFPPMGVLNNAVQLFGDRILGDLLDEPEIARMLLGILAEHEIEKLTINAAQGWRGNWYLFNCSVDMIGPAIYRDTVLEHDQAVARQARSLDCGVHLHHCGCFDRFAPVYQDLGPLKSMEIGFTSDPALAADFPMNSGPLYIILNHQILRTGTVRQVEDHVAAMLDKTAAISRRVVLLALDLDYGTPDANIRALLEQCEIDRTGRRL